MTKGQLVRSSDIPMMAPALHGVYPLSHSSNAYKLEPAVRYQALLRRYARAILLILLSCLAVSLLVTCLMTQAYKATAVVEVLPVNGDFMNNKDIDPNAPSSSMDTYLDTQTRLLKSEGLQDRVVAALLANPAEYQQKADSVFLRLAAALGFAKPPKTALEADIRRTLSNLVVKPEGQSSLISITVSGPSSQLAADVANAVANQHIASLQDARWATATQTTEFLTVQLSSLRAKLQQSENDLQAYAKKAGLIFTSDVDRESVGSEKLREVQSDLEKAEADRADKQAQMELINSTPSAALPRVLDDGSIRDAEGKLADLRRQLASLSGLYTPNHYKVMEVKAQIDTLEDQIKNQRALVVSRLKNDYKTALRKEALQRAEYDRQVSLVTGQSSKQVGYNLLKREVDANRDLYQSMLAKSREAGLVAALHSSNIRIVDRAKRPALPYEPNVLANTGIGILAGCMFSVLYILMRERSDGSIRTAGQTMKLLQARELAIIPAARRDVRTQILSAAQNGKSSFRTLLGKDSAASAADASKDIVKSWKTAGSVVAESFRSAVASIILWGRDPEMAHKVLVVTSAHSGAGKTTSVLNLGLGLVESGRRVLLIDGDLRIPRLGEIFGLKSAAGLTNVLAEGLHPAVASELICETGLEGLHILPSGPLYMNVTELLHLDALKNLLDYQRSQYDFILIDSPPALPLTDARLLAQHADGVVLVVKAGATTVEQTLTVQQCFVQDGSPIFGSILNHWDARAEDPAFMTSYMKYAVSSGHGRIAAVTPTSKRHSPAAGRRPAPAPKDAAAVLKKIEAETFDSN